MLVLVLLAIVWVAALTPMAVRKLREREAISSVTSFSHGLRRLSGDWLRAENGRKASAPIGFSAAARRLAHDQPDVTFSSDAGSVSLGGTASPPGPELGPFVSHATTIRRRRVVALLLAATLVSLALGFGVSVFFYLAVASVLALVAYLGLLAYFHQLAVERVQKVVALEARREMAMALDEARHLRGGLPLPAPRPRMGGSCWSVPGADTSRERELVSAGR